MTSQIADRSSRSGLILFLLLLLAGCALWASNAGAQSSYFTNTTYDCIGCHVGQTTSTSDYCGMCHKHGARTSGGTVNVAGA
jgi:nitrate/TMAO reductase-like tetraheme cytochrome c subunit